MKFFCYVQNNSGGSFDYAPDAGISHYVIVEATDRADADRRAEAIGLYFDGVAAGRDCDCCGDRWDRAYGVGDEAPQVYGKPVEDPKILGFIRWITGFEAFVHYADGTITGFHKGDASPGFGR